MAESKTAIVNASLTYIGHTQFVDDLEDIEDDSAERAIALANFDADLRFVLRAFDWPFATARARPAQLDATTLALGEVPGGWTYAFALPATSLKIRGIYAGVRNPRTDEQVKYVLERDTALGITVILTDEPAPEVVFTALVDDVSMFPPDFDDALAWRHAIKQAAALRKDPKTVQLAAAGYRDALAVAWSNAARENRGDDPPAPDWIAGRQ